MSSARAHAAVATVICLALFTSVSFSQGLAEPPRKAALESNRGSLLAEGRPDYLRQMRFFADSSSFLYAEFADTSSDTLLFVEKKTTDGVPRYWLLLTHDEKIVANSELTFATTSDGQLEVEGALLRSGEKSLQYFVKFSPAEQRVWCRSGESMESEHSGPSNFLLGIRFEPSFIFGSSLGVGVHSAHTDFEPAFSFVPMYKFFWSLLLIGQIGLSPGSGDDSFGGTEFGVYLRYTLPLDRVYILGGYADYEEPGNGHNFVDIPEGSYGFVSLGGGIQLGPHGMLDLSVLFPLKKTFGTEWDPYFSQSSHPKNVSAILKFGLCWYTDFSPSDDATP